jgi:signal transduction histidine kinase
MVTEHESEAELLRQARRLETACSIIQDVHSSLSLQAVIDVIVDNLVEIGGFRGATVAIDARVDNLELHHSATYGVTSGDNLREQNTPIFIRGMEVGTLTTLDDGVDNEAQDELLEFLLPTLFMGIEHATSFAEVMDYRKTLEDKVVERTAQLAEAHTQLARSLDELREAKAARDRFFANINHEIRTPLTQIMLAVDSIMRTRVSLDGNVLQRLDDVRASTRRLLHLVNSLLQLAAGDEGKLQIRPGPIDVARLLERLVRGWEAGAQKGQLTIEYVGPAECRATMDEAALETIAGNFLSNAIKFTPPGGRISVTLVPTDESVRIIVRDTGPGIDPEFVPKLFGRFERSATAVSKGVRGTGIGLSLSKELVELQRGTIEVVRHDNPSGTSFVVKLPRYQAVAAIVPAEERVPTVHALDQRAPGISGAAPSEVAPRREAEATILLAEDDPALQQHMAEILSEKYHVIVANNGREALALAAKHRPDVLVTDLEMPEMNGIELTQKFLEQQGGSSLAPVLIVSAHAGLGQRLAGFEAGAVDYVLKPFSADELLARIRSQLALRQLALKLHESEKLAALGEMSAGLAHELRNPANAIINALEPLWLMLPPEERIGDAAGKELYEVMRASAAHMRELCGNILNVSRSAPAQKRPENFKRLLSQAKLILKSALATVELVESDQLDRPLMCSGPMIEQILINLLDNAVHAAGRGGTVRVSAWCDNDRAIVEVSDSGPGVPVEMQNRIFDPFFTTKPVGEGTGLGLALSRRIALDHGGDLRLVRQIAGGAKFRLELPV